MEEKGKRRAGSSRGFFQNRFLHLHTKTPFSLGFTSHNSLSFLKKRKRKRFSSQKEPSSIFHSHWNHTNNMFLPWRLPSTPSTNGVYTAYTTINSKIHIHFTWTKPSIVGPHLHPLSSSPILFTWRRSPSPSISRPQHDNNFPFNYLHQVEEGWAQKDEGCCFFSDMILGRFKGWGRSHCKPCNRVDLCPPPLKVDLQCNSVYFFFQMFGTDSY